MRSSDNLRFTSTQAAHAPLADHSLKRTNCRASHGGSPFGDRARVLATLA
ncbi:hypothetical protein [Microtetraspora malaysiensis]|nr:hypothetical protein [Microtetraspora malaysiensis]